ncbi:MAG: 50S ribosomal protein L9 [Fibrobacteres bacterium]|nr:50S ribosomal protein L9 [Fibrobacterota bacterium]
MEVILQKDVDRLGKAFEMIKVKEGYALNYLLPRKLAVIATAGAKARIEADKKAHDRKEITRKRDAAALAKKLEDVSVTITVKVGEADQLYGSVTTQTIADRLAAEGHQIAKKDILLEEPIRSLGVYNVKINLHSDIVGEVKVWVVKEESTEA